MRVTNNMMNQSTLSSIQYNQSSLLNMQTQMASQKKVNVPSDAPSAIASILNANGALNKIDIYGNNITYLNGEVEVAEGSLSQVSELLQRLKTLTLNAANGTNSEDQLKSINDEVKQIKEQVVALANTNYQDQYIFSGNKIGTPAYEINDDGEIIYNGTSQTGNYKREYEISDNVFVSVNEAGDRIFGYSELQNPGPPLVYTGEGLMNTLNQLTTALDASPADFDVIRSQIDGLDSALSTVLAVRTELGGVQTRLTMTNELHENNKINYSTIQSNLQDVDMIQLISDITKQQTSLQASLSVGSQIMSLSLLDFM
ncbi:MAG: flagellar hook-associated protein FlgL [Candidatus Gastranaerophilales bacterium]|nr:flagellar hook-associated protein FlgL [Candidatus Gastranaerophilales bacterium]